MVKFVWVEAVDGSKVPVNPDRVAYLRRTAQGNTALVFSAFAGGLDQLEVAGDGAEVVAQLESAAAAIPDVSGTGPDPAPGPRGGRRARRAARARPDSPGRHALPDGPV